MCNHYRNPNEMRQLPRDLQHKIILPASNRQEMWPGQPGPVILARDGELEAVTMVVLGGVSIAGGSGTVLGVVLGVLVLGLASFALSLVNVPGVVINVLNGLMLIVAISVPIVARWFIRTRAKP